MDPQPQKIQKFEIPKSSIWDAGRSSRFAFYCPQCRSERRVAYHPKPDTLRHFLQIGMTTVFLTMVCWPLFGFKGVVLFFPLWAGFELYYRTRARAELSCDKCGFDPYLYLVDVKKARAQIEAFWRKKFQEKGVPYPGDAVVAEDAAAEFIKETSAMSQKNRIPVVTKEMNAPH